MFEFFIICSILVFSLHSYTHMYQEYCKVFNIRRTKYQNLNDSCLVLQLSVPNPLKPSVKSIMKM